MAVGLDVELTGLELPTRVGGPDVDEVDALEGCDVERLIEDDED